MRGFQYAAPQSLSEALQILTQSKGAVKPLVGGTDLIAQMKEGRHRPAVVMDVKGIPEMTRLDYEEKTGLHIGAAVSCHDIAAHPAVGDRYSSIQESCRLVGSVQIQNRASVGGNICNATPSADTVSPLLTYDARAVIVGPKGRREVPLGEFFTGPGTTVLAPEELLVEVVVPPPPQNSSGHYLRFTPREEMDIAVAGVASLVALKPGSRVVARARIVLAAVAPTAVRAREAEAVLEGKDLDEAHIREAGELAVRAASPITDVRGSVEYRKELIKVLTRRTLRLCQQSLGLA